jgi:methylglutaconyl-CoA hydratase
VQRVVAGLLKGGPVAQRRIKELIPQVWGNTPEEMAELTARTNAEARASEEGQDGLKAFLEKRRPGWMEAD